MPPKTKVKKEKDGKAMKGKKVKKEILKAKVKKEPGVEKRGCGKKVPGKSWEMNHYRHQVGFLDEVVKPPWKVCFGALGTGIIAVRPEETRSSSSSSSSKVKKEVKKEPADSEGSNRIPSEATVVLFLNSPYCGAMSRNGVPMSGYSDTLDEKSRSLHWRSQRADRGTKIQAIVKHQQSGGRVVVGVRGAAMATFKLLGVVTRISNIQLRGMLIEAGSWLISDGAKVHKNIGPACLDSGLKQGIGLKQIRYIDDDSLTKQSLKKCAACCFAEANCRLHFDELRQEGVSTYKNRPSDFASKLGKFGKRQLGRGRGRGRGTKREVKDEPADSSASKKRLRFKQGVLKEEPDEEDTDPVRAIKKERRDSADEEEKEKQQSGDGFKLGQHVERRDKGRAWGVGYVKSLSPLEVTAKDDPSANGYEWDEVRRISDKEVIQKRPAAILGMLMESAKKGKSLKADAAVSKTASSGSAPSQGAPQSSSPKSPLLPKRELEEVPPAVRAAMEDSQKLLGSSKDLDCSIIMSLSASSPSKKVAEADTSTAVAETSVDGASADSDIEVIDVKECNPPRPVATDDAVVGVDVE
jgi:hypothetical protein